MNLESPKIKMWSSAIQLAVLIMAILLIYVYFYNNALNLLAISQAIAGTAGLMIGLSFALSSIGYYWDFLDHQVGYRKYYGLVGFWLALIYSISLLFIDTEKYLNGFFKNFFSADFLLGLFAMAILTLMAIVSTKKFMVKLGPQRWRLILRLGYIAYALLVIRAVVLENQLWLDWADTLDGLPPPRIIISAFALFVIFLRGSLFISLRLKKTK